MNGRICVVTGATHGIGRATARALAASGATVLVHGRDHARARAVAEDISRDTGNPEVRFVQADFAQLAQVRRLAQQLHSLLRRLAGTGVPVNAVRPGLIGGQLFRGSPALLRARLSRVGWLFMLSPQQGARGSVYLATAPEVGGQSGGYYRGCRRAAPSLAAQSEACAARLWQGRARPTGLAPRGAPSCARPTGVPARGRGARGARVRTSSPPPGLPPSRAAA